MAVRIVETANEIETETLGAELAGSLADGDVVLVKGELGAGKTTLVRGAAKALGVQGPVTSPTFSIGHRYAGRDLTVSHLDLYRLSSLEHEDPGLIADHTGPGHIAFIEWPEAGGGMLPDARVSITVKHAGQERRIIEVHE